MRFSVVPHSFRRLLPNHMKSRDSHDLVVLCVSCYARVEKAFERHRASLFLRHGIGRESSRLEPPNAEEVRVRSAAIALSQHAAKLPRDAALGHPCLFQQSHRGIS